MERTGVVVTTRGLGLLAFGLLAVPPAPAWAGAFGICGMSATVTSVEEVSVLGAGSRKIISETDPDVVRSNSFQTLVTIEVRNPYLIDGQASCEQRMRGPQKFISSDKPEELRLGAELTMMWEYFIDSTPDGTIYQERWTVANPERR